jgi:hypothetical protein
MAKAAADKAEGRATGEQERRAVPRISLDGEVRLLLVKHGVSIACRIIDLSLKGCRVRSQGRFPAGSMVRVEVAFKVRGIAFRFCGITQWTDGQNQAGIRFVDVPARRYGELVEALAEVDAENAAKAAEQAAAKLAAEREAAAKLAAEQEAKVRRAAEKEAAAQRAAEAAAAKEAAREPLRPAIAAQAETPARAKSSGRERRVQNREAVNTSAVIHLINIASRLPGRILDLSVDGCRICCEDRFPVGIYTRAEVEFHLDGLPFRLGGVIQAIHDKRTVGIRFLDMSSRRREQIELLIEDIREVRDMENRE